MSRWIVPAIVCALALPARADNPYIRYHLTQHIGDGIVVWVPAHWHVKVDAKQGTVLAQQDPDRRDAAMLMLAMHPARPGETEDALLDAMVAGAANEMKVASHGAMPGGRGRMLIADGRLGDAAVRVGAVVVVANRATMAGVLVAKPAEFDALGSVNMIAVVLASVSAESDRDAQFAERERQDKRPDQPDLEPNRAPIAKTDFARRWQRNDGVAIYVKDSQVGTTEYGHYNSQGAGDTFSFQRDGSYELITVQKTKGGRCTTTSTIVEKGAYTMDGRRLVLKPKTAYGQFSFCSAKPEGQALKVTAARDYDVGMSDDGRLVMVGPSCGSFKEFRCYDHARWEMKPAN
ncbi:MAG TPA: hypothetical protein VMJ10_31815 [Kofleriaceae bacterium]|nr:hypothetical protein [Kofleriaceae bacterium]